MKVSPNGNLEVLKCLNVKNDGISKLVANLTYVFKSAFPIQDTQILLSKKFEVNEIEVYNYGLGNNLHPHKFSLKRNGYK